LADFFAGHLPAGARLATCAPDQSKLSQAWRRATRCLSEEPIASIIALCQFAETKSLLREPFAWAVDSLPTCVALPPIAAPVFPVLMRQPSGKSLVIVA